MGSATMMTETELPALVHQQQSQDDDVEVGGATVIDVEVGGATVIVPAEPVLLPLLPEPKVAREKGGFLKPVAETTKRERIAGGVGGFAVLTALMAMVLEQSVLVVLAGLLSAIVGPYLYYQETRLTDIRTLRETKAAVQAEVNRLVHSNQQLVQNVDDLTRSVDRLQEIEQALSVLNDKSDTAVEEFAQQVEENKDLLKQMKGNLKSSVLQNLLSVVLRSDVDRDFVIDEAEVADLIHRISNVAGVRIDEAKFRAACQGESVLAVMDMVKNLLKRANVAADERIFSFDHDLS
jgi:cell division protein FtsB